MSQKFEKCEIWALFLSAGLPLIVMSRTDAQNGLHLKKDIYVQRIFMQRDLDVPKSVYL